MKSKKIYTALIILVAFCFSTSVFAQSFDEAKRILGKIYFYNSTSKQYPNSNQTLYCGCSIIYKKKHHKPYRANFGSCGYKIRKNVERATRIEWEHVMPSHTFGSQRKCWKNGGRKNCSIIDEEFINIQGDMHNLFPAIGEINGDRSNFGFNEWNGKTKDYNQCQMVIDYKNHKVQPPKRSRGIVARAYLYMSNRYNITLSKRELKLFETWNKQYPPTPWECKRNLIISRIQGNDNPFITKQCGK